MHYLSDVSLTTDPQSIAAIITAVGGVVLALYKLASVILRKKADPQD